MKLPYKYLLPVVALLCALAAYGVPAPKNISSELKQMLEYLNHINEPDQSKYFDAIDEAEVMSQRENSDSAYLAIQFDKISYLSYQSMMDQAMEALDQLRKYTEQENVSSRALYDSWNNVVMGYMNVNRTLEAVTEMNRMLDYATQQKDNFGLATAYTILGTAYQHAYEPSMEHYRKALEYLDRSGIQGESTYIYMLMSNSANDNGEYEDVLRYTGKIRQLSTSPYDLQAAYILELVACTELDRKGDAKVLFDNLRLIWEKGELMGLYTENFANAMCLYLCKYGTPAQAQEYMKLVGSDNEGLQAKTEMEYYLACHDYKKAFEAQSKLVEIEHQRIADMQEIEFANATTYYKTNVLESEKKQLELQYSKKSNTMLWVILVALALLLGLGAYAFYLIRRANRRLSAEYKRTEEQRQYAEKQKERAQNSEEMKSVFINSMCHEMRTPMNSISGFTNLMFDEKYTPEQRKHYATLVRDNVEHLTHLLENMLDMSHLITMSEELERTQVDLGKLCERTLEESRKYNSQNLDLRIDAERNLKIDTNAEYLGKVLRELLVNAIKFTEKGRVSLCCYQDITNGKVVFTVTDTGTGIPEEKIDYVFEQYTKLDKFKPGIGIGLFVCRQICERLGMVIRIDPNYTVGCRVLIEYNL